MNTERGINWYYEANALCRELAQQYNLPLETVVGIVVNLSALTRWEENVEQAKSYLNGKPLRSMHFKHQLSSCDLIRAGVDPLKMWSATSFKYREFYNSILLKDGSVCIDTHMIQAYRLRHPRSVINSVSVDKVFKSKKYYTLIQNWVKREARKHNLKTFEMQSVLWVIQRAS